MALKFKKSLYCVLFLFCFNTAQAAVSLSQDQTGQALVVPYYTVANGLNTLISINNTQDQPKAIKIQVKDGFLGASIHTFNLYLDANDIWTMALIDDLTGPKWVSNDPSCVISGDMISPGQPNPPESDWSRETGVLEIVEMGQVLSESNDFFGGVSASADCDRINDAWYANGPNSFWQANASADMAPASGGLTADVSVIDVAKGMAFKVPVLAFDHFYPDNSIFHSLPETTEPNLSSGTKDSLLLYGGQAIETSWPTGYEAISALLMKTTVENEYDVTSFAAGANEWIISFPTLSYHKQNLANTTPFIFEDETQFWFPGTPSNDYKFFDRDGKISGGIWACIPTLPPDVYCPPLNLLSHVVNTYVVHPWGDELAGSRLSGSDSDHVRPLNLWGSAINTNEYMSGKARLYIKNPPELHIGVRDHYTPNQRGRNAAGLPQVFHGLPVTGFAVQMYQNHNAQPGLLATYATSKQHYGEQLITESGDQ